VKVTAINLSKCRPHKDFGKGFYLTDIKDQAAKMAGRVARLYGGYPVVSQFNLDENVFFDSMVRIMDFEKPSREWAIFVMNNRNREFNNTSDILCNKDSKYDIVIGAVANDDIAYLFRTFINGLIDIDTLVRGLEYKTLTKQYSFHSENALKYLKYMEILS
jgi:hypothetical protein